MRTDTLFHPGRHMNTGLKVSDTAIARPAATTLVFAATEGRQCTHRHESGHRCAFEEHQPGTGLCLKHAGLLKPEVGSA